mgnify:FL=1
MTLIEQPDYSIPSRRNRIKTRWALGRRYWFSNFWWWFEDDNTVYIQIPRRLLRRSARRNKMKKTREKRLLTNVINMVSHEYMHSLLFQMFDTPKKKRRWWQRRERRRVHYQRARATHGWNAVDYYDAPLHVSAWRETYDDGF